MMLINWEDCPYGITLKSKYYLSHFYVLRNTQNLEKDILYDVMTCVYVWYVLILLYTVERIKYHIRLPGHGCYDGYWWNVLEKVSNSNIMYLYVDILGSGFVCTVVFKDYIRNAISNMNGHSKFKWIYKYNLRDLWFI